MIPSIGWPRVHHTWLSAQLPHTRARVNVTANEMLNSMRSVVNFSRPWLQRQYFPSISDSRSIARDCSTWTLIAIAFCGRNLCKYKACISRCLTHFLIVSCGRWLNYSVKHPAKSIFCRFFQKSVFHLFSIIQPKNVCSAIGTRLIMRSLYVARRELEYTAVRNQLTAHVPESENLLTFAEVLIECDVNEGIR